MAGKPMTDKPVAFHDLPAEAFPFTLHIVDAETREVLCEIAVDGPGALEIPGFAPRKVDVIVIAPYMSGTDDSERPR